MPKEKVLMSTFGEFGTSSSRISGDSMATVVRLALLSM